MPRTFGFALALLLTFSACSSPEPATAPSPGPTPTPRRSSAALIASDRDKFLGQWTGVYGCNSNGKHFLDKLKIEAARNTLELRLSMFMTSAHPAVISAFLTSLNTISIDKQEISGATSTGTITFADGKITLKLKVLGVDCAGEDYIKEGVVQPSSSP